MAMDLFDDNVTVIALEPGPVRTELIQEVVVNSDKPDAKTKNAFANAETIYGTGIVIVQLLRDPNLHKLTGRVLPNCVVTEHFGLKDSDGTDFPNLLNPEIYHLLDLQYKYRTYGKGAADALDKIFPKSENKI